MAATSFLAFRNTLLACILLLLAWSIPARAQLPQKDAPVQLGRVGLGGATPANKGQLAQTLGANNITGTVIKRFTDTAPTGTFVDYQTAAGASIVKTDINGLMTSSVTGQAVDSEGILHLKFKDYITGDLGGSSQVNTQEYHLFRYGGTNIGAVTDTKAEILNLDGWYGTNAAGTAIVSGTVGQMGNLYNTMVVKAVGDALDEVANEVRYLRVDIGTGYSPTGAGGLPVGAPSGPTGKLWLTDWSMHGPIAVQPSTFYGAVLVGQNYYNGFPVTGSSAILHLETCPGCGGGSDTPHGTATVYPLQSAIQIDGHGTGANPGFISALRVGDTGGGAGPWLTNATGASAFTYGVEISDYASGGIYIHDRTSGATGPGIVVASGAGGVAIGGTAANGYALNVQGTGDTAYFHTTGAARTAVVFDATAAQQATFLFDDGGVAKWQMGKNTDNSFFLTDAALVPYMTALSGTLYLGGTGGYNMVQIGTGMQIGVPTGGDKGAGTLNTAGTYYQNGTAGVDCTGVTAGTVTVAKGIITHC